MSTEPSQAQPAPKRLTTRKKRAIVRQITTLQDRCRQGYNRMDALFDELRTGARVGEIIEAGVGLFRIVDNFDGKNVAFKTAAVKRFELKELNKTEAAQYREAQLPKPATPAETPAH